MTEDLQKIVPPLTCFGISLRPLSPKKRLFVVELMQNGFDKTKAAESAGYKQPNVKGTQLMKDPQVNRVVEKIQRKVGRLNDLKLEDVLQELSKSVFRDVRDLYDEEGNLLPVNELPDHIASVVDSVQEKVRYSKTGDVAGVSREYKLIPKASALDMALKVTGAYAPEKHEHAMSIDWDQLLEPPKGADSVEQELEDIEAEYEVERIEQTDPDLVEEDQD